MKDYHFIVKFPGLPGGLRILLQAHDTSDALARLKAALSAPVIQSAHVGNLDIAEDGAGRTAFPELRGQPLFCEPAQAAPVAEPVLL